ncbi:cell division topological determinant MinJ [Liquorilactobacillus sucicola DSM 21376 = JCM 15457]|uniref:PDZ domain-containing protein n=1 Tax=Liquorilactobacillus sucicola DSM 21376 = JCM 15457 TaxID=1423806 RepID=A0A023CWB6_9LACO|nr:PDZ domain-containing protein [Liquorilactobacillus sucicola]KRN05966.1 hypothetical protein FD15_GL001151 [Liquorilactobacillus sucicola DSM 21376 = JCM 15457]GAJ25881.1 cell division topological determinant MinJ [Liquorilactobacillus sucicola DSM 21376 = JCM 15457]
MWIFKLLLHFLMQPALWVCILVTFGMYQHRIKNERKHFRIAINRDFYEGRHLVKNGLFLGAVGSALTLIVGLTVPMQWAVTYEVLLCLGLLLLLVVDSGVLGLIMSLPLLFLFQQTGLSKQFFFKAVDIDGWLLLDSGSSIFALCALFFLFRYFMLRRVDQFTLTPSIHNGKRGRRLIQYTWHEAALVPLLVLIPGNLFHSMFSFWPFLSIHGQTFELFILPFGVTAAVKFWRRPLQTAIKKVQQQTLFLAICSFVFGIISFFWSQLTIVGLMILLFLAGAQVFSRTKKEKRAGRWYAETNSGVRVIAIQPHTPAAKMNLSIGDVIVSCNGVSVANENELYAALKLDSTYCRFRVQTYQGDLKLAESAIFADSPHELGLIIFH